MQNFNMQRVKVYRLNRDGLWDDKGTGHVSMEYMEQSDSVGLVVISEEDTRTLLIHRISREDIYQRQGDDTIITWSDPEIGTDIALSFQEPQGCNYVWGQILEVQGHFNSRDGAARRRGAVDEFDMPSNHMGSETFTDGSAGNVDLPAPELGNLANIAKVLSECSPFQKEKVAQQMLRPGYIRKLLDLFRTCEDLEDKESLSLLYKTVKAAIMLNDTSMFEVLLKEENVMDVVGALEHDPELSEQQKYRDFLRDSVVFKEVVPIKDSETRAKIHQTYRIGYIKDVILPRVLDDATFATLASLMLFNNVEVLMSLQSDAEFMRELFDRLRRAKPHEEEWRDLVAFLQELCSLAKHLQASHRMQLFTKLLDLGMLDVLTEVMKSGDAELRLRSSDVLLSTLQHDPSPLRTFLLKQPDHTLFTLLVGSLIENSHTGSDVGVQVLEMLRLLLDPESMEQSVEKNEFLELFYDKYIDKLVQTLASGLDNELQDQQATTPATLGIIVELLCFCVQHHSYRIKYYILRNNVAEKVLCLLNCRHRWLMVAAIRFLRTCIGLKDDFYNRYLVRNNLLDPVVKAFIDNGPRYNLLNSAILELVDFVRRENVKGLISHLVEQFYDQTFASIDYVDTFKQLKLKYDQLQERATSAAAGTSTSATHNARELLMANRRRRDNERGLDKDEEDYFNEDDDHETVAIRTAQGPSQGPSSRPSTLVPAMVAGRKAGAKDEAEVPSSASRPHVIATENGTVTVMTASPSGARPLFSLVDYDDDDEEQEQGDDDDEKQQQPQETSAQQQMASTRAASTGEPQDVSPKRLADGEAGDHTLKRQRSGGEEGAGGLIAAPATSASVSAGAGSSSRFWPAQAR